MSLLSREDLTSGPRRSTLSTTGLAAGLSVLVLALGACSADGGDAAADAPAPTPASSPSAGASPEVTVIQPGSPGEEAVTGGPVEVPEPGYEHSDVAFMQMMIPHHAQALTMSELAVQHAVDPTVRILAERIMAAQGPEIVAMSSWLEERNLDVPTATDDPRDFDHGDHGHDPMMGMMTPAQLDELAAARGGEFDRLFLAGMIRHHQGALDMVANVAVGGEDLRVAELAADIDVTQRVEIQRMQDLLG